MNRIINFATPLLGSALLVMASCKKDPAPPANAAPVASNVNVTGVFEVNKTLTATYAYADAENDAQGTSSFQWYVATTSTGTGETAIAGATGLTYLIAAADQGKYIRFGVTPKAATGTTTGTEVKSAWFGSIGEATTVTFTYNGQIVTYGIITSVTTGKKWLDRNLGAANVPSAYNNYQNYGDLFQWGRLADGHQLVSRTGPNDADATGVNGMTSTVTPFQYSSTDNPGHNKFIVIDGTATPFDWRKPQNNNLWQGVAGINNPCPSGWRLPTKAEWTAENLTSVLDGFSKLKITLTGRRYGADGSFLATATNGQYWSSTAGPDNSGNPTNTFRISFTTSAYSELSSIRSTAFACRCIKD